MEFNHWSIAACCQFVTECHNLTLEGLQIPTYILVHNGRVPNALSALCEL
jgi:hypothetical protein